MTGISKPPIIGVLKETQLGERRVALMPADARRLASRARIFIESGAGDAAGFPDRDYLEVGAAIVQRPTILDESDGVLAIHAPADLSRLKMGALLISLGGRDVGVVEVARARHIPHLARPGAASPHSQRPVDGRLGLAVENWRPKAAGGEPALEPQHAGAPGASDHRRSAPLASLRRPHHHGPAWGGGRPGRRRRATARAGEGPGLPRNAESADRRSALAGEGPRDGR